MKEKFAYFISYTFTALALYVGIWVMFLEPIIYICKMFDNGSLTGTIIFITILKCIFAFPVGKLIHNIGLAIALAIIF